MVVRVRPDRMPDACPEPSVLMRRLMRVVVRVGMGVTGRVLLVPHPPSMARKTGCSTSIPATRVRLPTPRISFGTLAGAEQEITAAVPDALRLAEVALGLG